MTDPSPQHSSPSTPANSWLVFGRRWLWAISLVVMAAAVGVLVLWLPEGLYLWLKAFHVIAVIAWMAGMLYLPRLFVDRKSVV